MLDRRALLLAAALGAGCTPSRPSGPPTVIVTPPPPASATTEAPPPRKAPSAEPSSIDTTPNADGDRIAAGWNPDEMAAVPRPDEHPPEVQVTTRILKWRVDVDERPLYVEGAILWLKFHSNGAPDRWMLAKVFRHPKDDHRRDWQLSIVFDAPRRPFVIFDHPPRNADVKRFEEASWWSGGMAGFEQLGAGVCRNGWKKVIGEGAPEK